MKEGLGQGGMREKRETNCNCGIREGKTKPKRKEWGRRDVI